MNIDEWKKIAKYRGYAHFDRRLSKEEAWGYVSDPEKIKTHGFFPFIRYTITIKKYSKKKGRTTKRRVVCYSAHKDRYIYQFYSFLLNQEYNKRVKSDGLNYCAIAYRNNLGKNNIDFAKKAFDKIKQLGTCYIIIGDFTSFFDKLDHKYLKERICDLLQTDKLSEDYYAVYKNITKFSTWDLSDLLKDNGLPNNTYGIRRFNKRDIALPLGEYKTLKRKRIKPNKNSFGIPQGSAISAVLSNIYMLEFDAKINSYVSHKNGLYMRYSDDFIIVVPKYGSTTFDKVYETLMSIIGETPSLELEPNKTQLFEFELGEISSIEIKGDTIHESKKKRINYLGFSFDGNVVTIRDKTISKYYNKLNRNIRRIIKSEDDTETQKIIKRIRLYKKFGYHANGVNNKNRNFLTYIDRTESIFGTNERVSIVKKRHIQKIRRKLRNKI
ncbi:reverse transcriptase/maturase family protein [Paenibacillus macerans]|uniref:Reverse transcriptase domain-containing protein n=1 Tax=Paenibacillus macerans TaxID=44252 RepID=A0A6N8EZU6_PAEMA|nr:reverse transcriptase/maturase family protein [Paenibacillus macerans]MEC0136460.1 reverse transcriptase/maturase family protein [Paenibacillus macerans]MUG25195.1 hypothetical protein [Paenibacillus macerans]UMV47327.1 reverse transcriptase/maturase family protein [Paenibacillus macerans]GIP11281.1 hypothetical protein J1TS5_34510 [Paenibacillus macerans]